MIDFDLFNEVFNKDFIPNKDSITWLKDYILDQDIIKFKERLKYNFEQSLNIKLYNDNLTFDEENLKNILIKEKYSNKEWNFYGKETRMA